MSSIENQRSSLSETLAFIEAAYQSGKVEGQAGRIVELGPAPVRADDIELIVEAVRRENPSRTIETGFAFGFSGLALLGAMMDAGVEEPIHTAIDPYQFDPRFGGAGMEAFKRFNLHDHLQFYHEGSETVLPRLVSEEKTFDLAFVDGGHWFENVFLDLYYLSKIVAPGGLIMVDDMWMPSVRQAVDYAIKNLAFVHENAREPRMRLFKGDRNVKPDRRSAQDQVALLRVPSEAKPRKWDHFADFGHRW